MGALNAYIISENIGRPALMFNPPLSKYRSVEFKPKFKKGHIFQMFRLGGKDEIDVAAKIADALEVSLDFLIGKVDQELDQHPLKRMIEVQQMGEDDKEYSLYFRCFDQKCKI
ncbi:hypothetical protein MKO06_15370 [Gramella sp. GC03-9]|uniref:HTH cro/C1-type domain-containing protein n=1 Tax=Christiangramia oceanisediminis TaxID=2920386 RepID=A0A9X2KZW6_9FLAO|nr:hypothetical protein [Gramella oceanisediminis]MCP9201289.1 hypothetical protein [Gramella oceanisediminis]